MSFILDALKKSERERQRQTGPALFEVQVAPPRNRFPVWVVVIGILLVINSGVLAWLLFHNASKKAEAQAAATAPPVVSAPPATAPMTPAPQLAATQPPPSSGGAEYFGNPAGATYNRQQAQDSNESASQDSQADNTKDEPQLRDNSSDEGVLNPEDYEPASEKPRTGRSAKAQRKPRASASNENEPKSEARDESNADSGAAEDQAARKAEKGVPSYQDAVAMPGLNLPQLRLDLHVYDSDPGKSFALVNMQKVKPGDTFAQGVHVDQITPNGAIMSYHGVRFLLHSE